MIREIAFLTAAAVALGGCQQASPPASASAAMTPSVPTTDVRPQAGRYQLFQGWYRFINLKGEESRAETLFKIGSTVGELGPRRATLLCAHVPNNVRGIPL